MYHWIFLAVVAVLSRVEETAPSNTGGFAGQGGCGAALAAMGTEVCDGADNDGDGSVDEGLTMRACSTACGTGQEICRGWLAAVRAPAVFAESDGSDNDCDGKVDELLVRTCTTACPGTGEEVCTNGDWNGCDAPMPAPEACDGQDNDCDGDIDEEVFQACDVECGMGTQVCANGQFGTCEAQGLAGVCEDDDCDGNVDEGCGCQEVYPAMFGDIGAYSSVFGGCRGWHVGDCVNQDNASLYWSQVNAQYDYMCLPVSGNCEGITDDVMRAACEAIVCRLYHRV